MYDNPYLRPIKLLSLCHPGSRLFVINTVWELGVLSCFWWHVRDVSFVVVIQDDHYRLIF